MADLRKKVMKDPAEAPDFLASVLSGISDLLWITDEDYTVRFVNEAVRRLHGDVVGKKCFKVTRSFERPCYHHGIPCEVHELLEKGKDHFEEKRLSSITKRVTHVHATPMTMPDGRRGVLTVSRDVTEEVNTKQRLEAAYSMLRATLESTVDGILVVDNQERIVEFNKRFVQMLQAPEPVMESRDDRRLLSYLSGQLKDPEGFMKRTRELFAQPDLEYSDLLEFKDGRVYERYSRPQKIGGETVGRVISLRDVTERRRAEEALKSSLEFSTSLMENSLNPILVVNPDTSIAYVNPALERLTGYSSSELLGRKPPYPWWPMDKIKETTKRLQENMKRGLTHYEENFKNKNGEDFWVEINAASIIRDGEIKYYLSNWVDITQRKKMEEEIRRYATNLEELVKQKSRDLARSEQLLKTTMESTPDHVFVRDRDRKFVYVNDSYCRFLGKPRDMILGRTLYDLYPKEQADSLTREDDEVFEKGLVFHRPESAVVDAGGAELVIDVIKAPLRDPQGNVTHLVGFGRDITERKRIEQMRDEFISAVTHELRTPLVSVKGYVDLALTKGSGRISSEIESLLQVARRNTDRLLSLVNDLLDAQRLQAGRLPLNLEPLDFRKVLEACKAEIKPFLEEKRLSLKVEAPEAELPVNGDEIRLSQVLMNLLSNAVKFSPEGGRIELAVEDGEEAVKIRVSDTGIGIRKEDLPRVFEPFAAIPKPTYIKGTGLGLNISKGLVEAHGGKIWAESEGEGKGATFTFTIPKLQERVVD
ncbi:PAS domain S-box protein [Candidatus Bathyarchaeota archaeon]|nr:PAS domain S-box protein [Candidatus Bathyarchaeota archaeon]